MLHHLLISIIQHYITAEVLVAGSQEAVEASENSVSPSEAFLSSKVILASSGADIFAKAYY
jgi:hypothetical protein